MGGKRDKPNGRGNPGADAPGPLGGIRPFAESAVSGFRMAARAALAALALAGCPDCGPGPEPDAGKADSGRPDSGTPDAGPICSRPTGFLACGTVDPDAGGKVEVSGLPDAGPWAGYNGYGVVVPPGATEGPALFCETAALGVNLPNPDGGEIVARAHGVELLALDNECPMRDGNPNEVPLLPVDGGVEVFFKDHRGQVLFFDEANRRFERMPFGFVPGGTVGRVPHLSPFYLMNTPPVVDGTADDNGDGTARVSFPGTLDEGSPAPHMLRYQVRDGAGGALLAESMGIPDLRFPLSPGNHALELRVVDPYGKSGSAMRAVTMAPIDAGIPDSGVPDSGQPDAGPQDSGMPDSGTQDAGQPDSGQPDAGTTDAGTQDAGQPDSGMPDAGTQDSGTPDSGTQDAGQADSGTQDSGTQDAGQIDSGSPDAGIDAGTPAPTVSGLGIDCSSTGNQCGSQGLVYPVTFNVADATSCTAGATRISGLGTSGTTSAVTLVGNSGSFTYTTGSDSGDIIRITVTCIGPGGSDSKTTDVTIE